MAYDSLHDEILVPSFFAFAILTFRGDASGDVSPVRKIFGSSTQLLNPQAVAVDGVHGEIFVPQGNRVLLYPRDANGDVAPIRILEGTDTGLGAGRVTIDPLHNLMITANATGGEGGTNRSGHPAGIRIFDRMANGNTKPLRT